MKTPGLQPCPFCGADVDMKSVDHGSVVEFYVWCRKCQASGGQSESDFEASQKWNRRHENYTPHDIKTAESTQIIPSGVQPRSAHTTSEGAKVYKPEFNPSAKCAAEDGISSEQPNPQDYSGDVQITDPMITPKLPADRKLGNMPVQPVTREELEQQYPKPQAVSTPKEGDITPRLSEENKDGYNHTFQSETKVKTIAVVSDEELERLARLHSCNTAQERAGFYIGYRARAAEAKQPWPSRSSQDAQADIDSAEWNGTGAEAGYAFRSGFATGCRWLKARLGGEK